MEQNVDLIERIVEEEESFSDDALFNITSFGVDMSFREIISMYEDGDLEKPEMQRKYVWDKKEASRFIDSILLGLPVPSIFLAKTPSEKRLIVDGYQRIMTVYHYVKTGVFGGDGSVFALSNTAMINPKWRNKTFKQLTDEEQRKIRNAAIHAIIFEQKYPQNDNGMYQVFERINTSGRTLKPQEIRNCVYHGKFNRLLLQLNEHNSWRSLYGKNTPESRMSDVELILRVLMFINVDFTQTDSKQINLSKQLNVFMGDFTNLDEVQEQLFTEQFIKVSDYLFETLGNNAFRNGINDNGEFVFYSKINPAIMDSLYRATWSFLTETNEEEQQIAKSELLSRYQTLLSDADYQNSIKQHTTNIDNIQVRYNLAKSYLFGVANETGI